MRLYGEKFPEAAVEGFGDLGSFGARKAHASGWQNERGCAGKICGQCLGFTFPCSWNSRSNLFFRRM